MTYKELKDNFFKEVGKIDVSKLGLSFGGLKEYAELLKLMAEIPEETRDESFKNADGFSICNAFAGLGRSEQLPKTEKESE